MLYKTSVNNRQKFNENFNIKIAENFFSELI
jgi:hypothetical protein